MRSTILIGLTFFVLASGTWATSVVCHQPQMYQGIDPLAPISFKVSVN